jgi:hypothetical protein
MVACNGRYSVAAAVPMLHEGGAVQSGSLSFPIRYPGFAWLCSVKAAPASAQADRLQTGGSVAASPVFAHSLRTAEVLARRAQI